MAKAAAEQLGDAAGEQEHHQRIERQQPHRRQQHRTAQVLRLAHAVDISARIEAGKIERRQAVVRRERVDRQQPFGWTIEAGWVICVRAAGIAGRNRTCIGGGRSEHAEAVEDAGWRDHLAAAACAVTIGGGARAGERNNALEHVDEGTG
jgi:hypothetical protein